MSEVSCYVMKPLSYATDKERTFKNLRSVDLKRVKKQRDLYKLSYGKYGSYNYVSYVATRDFD
jgi:hypothetical protein